MPLVQLKNVVGVVFLLNAIDAFDREVFGGFDPISLFIISQDSAEPVNLMDLIE